MFLAESNKRRVLDLPAKELDEFAYRRYNIHPKNTFELIKRHEVIFAR